LTGVCKTSIRGFESHPRLHIFKDLRATNGQIVIKAMGPISCLCRTCQQICFCESALASGVVVYGPKPPDSPADENLLICRSQRIRDGVIDLCGRTVSTRANRRRPDWSGRDRAAAYASMAGLAAPKELERACAAGRRRHRDPGFAGGRFFAESSLGGVVFRLGRWCRFQV
jgi:hypothetical protein